MDLDLGREMGACGTEVTWGKVIFLKQGKTIVK